MHTPEWGAWECVAYTVYMQMQPGFDREDYDRPLDTD